MSLTSGDITDWNRTSDCCYASKETFSFLYCCCLGCFGLLLLLTGSNLLYPQSIKHAFIQYIYMTTQDIRNPVESQINSAHIVKMVERCRRETWLKSQIDTSTLSVVQELLFLLCLFQGDDGRRFLFPSLPTQSTKGASTTSPPAYAPTPPPPPPPSTTPPPPPCSSD